MPNSVSVATGSIASHPLTRGEALMMVAQKPNVNNAPRGRNEKGRAIMVGPRGGMYVKLGKTKKYIMTTRIPAGMFNVNETGYKNINYNKARAPYGSNSKGRVVYQGPSGGRYIKTNKGKRYLKK